MLYSCRMADRCSGGLYSKEGSAMLKGVAILTMLYSHFFGMFGVDVSAESMRADRVFAFLAGPASQGHGALCLALFAFVTGFGYCVIAGRESRGILRASVARLKRFYPFFLAFCGLFICLAYLCPYSDRICPEQVPSYFLTMVGLRHGITDYWYISVFLLSALFCFPLLLFTRRNSRPLYIALCILLVLCPGKNVLYAVCFHVFSLFMSNPSEWVVKASTTCYFEAITWIPYFMMGWLLAALVQKDGISPLLKIGIIVIAILCGDTSSAVKVYFLISLLLVYILQRVPGRWVRPLILLGNYSACMWLNHRLIFGYWFAGWFYGLPTPLNYGLLVVLSFLLSVLITKTWNRGLQCLVRRG